MNTVGHQQERAAIKTGHASPFFWSLLAAGLILLAALIGQTQWLAIKILGKPGWHMPWHGIQWIFTDGLHSTEFVLPSLIQLIAGFGLSFLVFGYTFKHLRANKPITDLHGTASWSTFGDAQRLGLTGDTKGKPAVFVGGIKRAGRLHYLRDSGPQHMLLVAPTRSGKGVSIILPTLLSWSGSMIVTDMKGELWALTAGWRSKHANQNVYRLDLGDPDSARFNPLSAVRLGSPHVVGDAQNIATNLVDPDGKGMDGRDGHWRKGAHALITGLIVYAAETGFRDGKEATLSDVAAMLAPIDRTLTEVLEEICECENLPKTSLHAAKSAARVHLARQGEEAASVLSTTINYLQLFQDPIIARATSTCDFTAKEVTNGARPATLYLVASPDDKDRTYPVMRLIITSLVRRMTRELDFENGQSKTSAKWQTLFLMDEFTSFGRLDIFASSMAFMAAYGLRAMIVVQDFSQIWATYGRDESITSNCHIKVAFAPNKQETAEHLSKLAGTTTVVKREKTSHSNRVSLFPTKDDRYIETRRPLMTADEIMRLPSLVTNGAGQSVIPGQMIVYMAGENPLLCTQPIYFTDNTLKARAKVTPPESPIALWKPHAVTAIELAA